MTVGVVLGRGCGGGRPRGSPGCPDTAARVPGFCLQGPAGIAGGRTPGTETEIDLEVVRRRPGPVDRLRVRRGHWHECNGHRPIRSAATLYACPDIGPSPAVGPALAVSSEFWQLRVGLGTWARAARRQAHRDTVTRRMALQWSAPDGADTRRRIYRNVKTALAGSCCWPKQPAGRPAWLLLSSDSESRSCLRAGSRRGPSRWL